MFGIPLFSLRRLRQSSTAEVRPVNRDDGNGRQSSAESEAVTAPSSPKGKRFASVKFVPTVGHALEDWLDIPNDPGRNSSILFNSVTLPFKWLLWTSKALAGLPPHQSLRERLCNQSASLGSVAGLFLVIAISAFFVPPTAHTEVDKLLVEIYGVLMFLSAMSLTVYVCLALTVMYPLLESIPDFAALEVYQNLAKHWGGYELFLFNFGCQAVLVAMMVSAKVVYSLNVLYVILGVFAVLYCTAAFMTREFFIAIDPITTVHMGICNAPHTLARAHALAAALRSRHQDFLQGAENLKEHAATHYMEPQARLLAEQRMFTEELAASDKKAVVEKWQHAVKGASVRGTVQVGTESKADEVQNIEDLDHFPHTNAAPTGRQIEPSAVGTGGNNSTSLPTLEDIFIGENRLILTQGASDMSAAECELVYNILLKQGCRSTAHVVRLLRWSSGSRGGNAAHQRLTLFVSLGMPAFHAMEVIDYLESIL